MGLLLSVLVVCVGVLEVIACVRHFQDGYLPLWTPHCAVTSGYAITHERWRNKPSDSFEFRSSNDVSGTLNHAQDQSSETFLHPSVSVENGYTAKHDFEEVTPSTEVCHSSDVSSFTDDNRVEGLYETDGVSPILGTQESDLDLISTYDKEPNIPSDEYDERKDISTDCTNSNLICEHIVNHPERIDSPHEALFQDTGINFSKSSNEFEDRTEKTSNILSKNHIVTDVYHGDQISGEETIRHEISNKPETSARLVCDRDRSVESVKESTDEIIIPNVSSESKDEDRIPDKYTELDIDTSQRVDSIEQVDNVYEPIEERQHVPLSETQSNIFQERSLEETSLPNSVRNVPESGFEAGETKIKNDPYLQEEIDIVRDDETSDTFDVENAQRSRESTPQVYQEYVPLTHDQIKSGIPVHETSGGSIKPENQIEISQNTSILENEHLSQQEFGGISKYDENEYIQDDRESTPQPISEEGIKDIPKPESTLSLQESGNQLEFEPVLQKEVFKIDERDTPESRLESQTTSTEFVVSKNEEKEHEPKILVSKPEIPEEAQKHHSAFPLTIDTSEESPSITRHSSHQSSLSPPQLPSTPTKKSKADISWPTFFPGAPVIKRPSVSFATPEAIFTNEDQELLRQYTEEEIDITPCLKKTDETLSAADTEDKTPSSTEDKSWESVEASERNDSFEEDILPVTFKERSPSNIVAGNDFSRKELQLQKKKSYKQKRYSSASELNTRDEEAEDRSFSENKPSIVRASSLKESRRRFRKPPKASSFEDAMLFETSKISGDESTAKKAADASNIPVIEEKETENQRERVVSFQGVAKEEGDEHNEESNKRNESNTPKPQHEGRKEEIKSEPDSWKEGKDDEEESSYSASEEQSSSQQKSPAKEAFWVSEKMNLNK